MEITEKQQIAIAALVAGKKRAECAKLADVSESTLYNWLSEEKFRKELKRAQSYIFDESTAQLHGLHGQSVETCRRILNGERLSPLELRAANLVFSQVSRLRELDLEDRIRELEKQFETKKR